jgi:hypothetical protein
LKLRSIAATVVAALAGMLALAGSATAWAPADSATVHPGVMTFTNGGQCTANFVFEDGSSVYIGQAAHCSGTDGNTATNGCEAGSLPVGTQVEVDGASQPGTMVYNSWIAMQEKGETDADTCQYNDFALVRLAAADVDKVNPSVPYWGGPTGLGGATSSGEDVYSYGNSSLRLGVSQLSPKKGTSLGTDSGGWNHTVYTVTPGIPGDSGSGFVDASGRAFGTLSTVAIAPLAGSNGVGDLAHELDYMRANSSLGGVQLVNGTEPFQGGLPVGR